MAVSHRITAALFVLLSLSAIAQDLPEAPKPETPKAKTWLDTQTKVELSLAFGSLAADGYTTIWNGGHTTHEINPLLGNGSTVPRVTTYFTASAAALVGGNYLLRNHRRLRHVLNWTTIGVESAWVAHNTSNHRR